MVPTFSIVFMVISGVIAFGLPIISYIYFNKKIKLNIVPMFFGIAGFVVFALVLESMLHAIVLKPQADGTIPLINNNPYMYILYGIFAAGIFEETARFICFNILKKKYSNIRTGISYGIGHGGIECVAIVGIAMVSNILISILINTGNMSALGGIIPPELVVDPLINTPSYIFFLSGFERICAFTFHVAASVVVWTAVNYKGMIWLFPVAICMHAAFNVPAAAMQAGFIQSIILVEAFCAVGAVIAVLIAIYITKKMKGRSEMLQEAVAAPTPLPVSEPASPDLPIATEPIPVAHPTTIVTEPASIVEEEPAPPIATEPAPVAHLTTIVTEPASIVEEEPGPPIATEPIPVAHPTTIVTEPASIVEEKHDPPIAIEPAPVAQSAPFIEGKPGPPITAPVVEEKEENPVDDDDIEIYIYE